MKGINLLSLVLVLTGLESFSQSVLSDSTAIKRNVLSLNFSYFGQGSTHYGLKVGTEYTLAQKLKSKVRKNGVVIDKKKEIFATANVGWYVHKRNHVGVFINSEIAYRKTRKNGFNWGLYLGAGYLHTFLQGDAYSVTDNNEVEKIPLAGQSNFIHSLSFSIGKDFGFKGTKPFAFQVKRNFFLQTPHNTTSRLLGSMEVGITYKFKLSKTTK